MGVPLSRNRPFLLWIGQGVSQLGNQFPGLALPLIAVITLHASAAQMGLLGAMGTLPFLQFGLLAVLWVAFSPVRTIGRMPKPLA